VEGWGRRKGRREKGKEERVNGTRKRKKEKTKGDGAKDKREEGARKKEKGEEMKYGAQR